MKALTSKVGTYLCTVCVLELEGTNSKLQFNKLCNCRTNKDGADRQYEWAFVWKLRLKTGRSLFKMYLQALLLKNITMTALTGNMSTDLFTLHHLLVSWRRDHTTVPLASRYCVFFYWDSVKFVLNPISVTNSHTNQTHGYFCGTALVSSNRATHYSLRTSIIYFS